MKSMRLFTAFMILAGVGCAANANERDEGFVASALIQGTDEREDADESKVADKHGADGYGDEFVRKWVYALFRRPGLVTTRSKRDFEDTYSALVSALDANPAIRIVATLDHQANAARVGLDLPPTREIFFGNPNLGTPLMQASQTAGIDLPQKILVWETHRGTVKVAYNDPAYLQARHRIRGASAPLETIAGALKGLVETATGRRVKPSRGYIRRLRLSSVRRRPGLRFVRSENDADETFQRLRAAVDAAPPLSELFALEHDRNAASVGLELRPTKLLVFGNPALGTPLMQSARSIGIDLPQKFLVLEDERGSVWIAYNDPRFLAQRHRVRGQRQRLDTIAGALANIAAGAASD